MQLIQSLTRRPIAFATSFPSLHHSQFVTIRRRLAKEWSPDLGRRCLLSRQGIRWSSSSNGWRIRQASDIFTAKAKVQRLKSRAAYKLLEINKKYKIFRAGQTVVDLGYAPGSWSQVAADQTSPEGRVIGIDIIPAQPPRGVSTIQGNFLSPAVQNEVKEFLRDSGRAMLNTNPQPAFENIVAGLRDPGNESDFTDSLTLQTNVEPQASTSAGQPSEEGHRGESEHYSAEMRLVDVVLSDMSAPWEMTDGFWKRSLSDPHYRMMNTSGMSFRDHAGSMDLCQAALHFGFDTLRAGGHFVCKFYQGSEDKQLELRLRALFAKVYREKPASSRTESKEAYFVALRRKAGTGKSEVFGDSV